MKKLLTILLMMMFVFTLTACEGEDDPYFDNGGKVKDDDVKDDEEIPDPLSLTLEELAMYDGKDGNKAYVAVNDVLYDVTDEWTNGEHNGMMAGTDVSEAINNAPHGTSVLEDLTVVGELVASEEAGPQEFTLTELAMYDGKDGNPAYIAVNGIVYDVTDEWTNGEHNGNTAGQDLSNVINNAPHGDSVLNNLEEVGILVEE